MDAVNEPFLLAEDVSAGTSATHRSFRGRIAIRNVGVMAGVALLAGALCYCRMPRSPAAQVKSTSFSGAGGIAFVECNQKRRVHQVTYPEADKSGVLRDSGNGATIALFGQPGVGKRNLIDLLAGGSDVAIAGNDATLYTVAFKQNAMQDGSSISEHSQHTVNVVLDAPAADEQSCKADLRDGVAEGLRLMKTSDAVLLVLDGASPQCTPEIEKSFTWLRAHFKPSVWQKVVMVYSHFAWVECPGGPGVMCITKKRRDLELVHQSLVNCGIDAVTSVFGDVRCSDARSRDCVPATERIPFVGYALTMQAVKQVPGLLDERNYKVFPNDVQQLGELARIVTEKAHSNSPLNTSGDVNYVAACDQARIGETSNDGQICGAANNLDLCYQAAVQPKIREWLKWAATRESLIQRYGFCLRGRPSVSLLPANIQREAAVYRDLQAFETCQSARTSEVSLTAAERVLNCFQAPGDTARIHSELERFFIDQERKKLDFRRRLGFFVHLLSRKPGQTSGRAAAAKELLRMLVPETQIRSEISEYANCTGVDAWDDASLRCRPACAAPPLPAGSVGVLHLTPPPAHLSFNGGAYFDGASVRVQMTPKWQKRPYFIVPKQEMATCQSDGNWKLQSWTLTKRPRVPCQSCSDCVRRKCSDAAGLWKDWDGGQTDTMCGRTVNRTKQGTIIGAGAGAGAGCAAGAAVGLIAGPLGAAAGCAVGGLLGGGTGAAVGHTIHWKTCDPL